MFDLRDIPTLDEIRQQIGDLGGGLDATALLATLRMLRVASDILIAFQAHLGRHGTAMGRFSLLMLLRRREDLELGPSELAERAGVTRATVTGLLDGLEREGLVRRRAHSGDRRRISVELTAAGHTFVTGMIPDHLQRISALMAHLSEGERMLLLGLLEKVEKGMGALREP